MTIRVQPSLADGADPAIIRFARFLARQAAREDHEREMKAKEDEDRRDLSPVQHEFAE